jgi:tripartite ATP-independent transporter DctM subunit
MTNLSVGKLLIAGALPGVLLALLLSAYIFVVGRIRPFPEEGQASFSLKEIGQSFVSAFPALMTPVILVGGIVFGIFTPTEASAIGCVYSALVGFFLYRELAVGQIWRAIVSSAKLSCQILLIVAAASYFGNALAVAQVPQTVFSLFTDMAANLGPVWGLVALNVILLIVGMFLDSTAILIILVPILAPLAKVLGVDDVHLAVIIVFNVMVGLLTPPVGMILFVMVEVAKIKFGELRRAVIPFIAIMIVGLGIVTFVPTISTFVPNLVFGSR